MDPSRMILPLLLALLAASAQIGSILILVWVPPHRFRFAHAAGAVSLSAAAMLLLSLLR